MSNGRGGIPNEVVEEIISRSDIVSVVGQYVQFTKSSGQNMFGLCPFHSEDTPSFSVSVNKQIYYCFGCHKGGNVVNFIMEIEHLSYFEALKFLAEKSGVTIPEPDDANYRKEEQLRKRLKLVLLEAARYYYKSFKSEKGEEARKYLQKRAIAPATATKFGLGYAPNEWSGLYNHLVSKGFSQNEIQKSGLFVTKNGKTFDLFRGRLMFPIFNAMGELIAFGGRIIGDGQPKYVNSPETPVYSKQRNLYALNFAKQAKMKQIIVVEGYMDVISMHQAGVTNAVASLGTALTERQLDLLERYCEEVVLFYDSDRAGQNAAVRGLKMLMERKKKHTGMTTQVRVAKVPNGKDPDEFIREFGKDEFAKVVDQAVPVLDYLVDSAHHQSMESGRFDPVVFQQLISTYLSWEDNMILRERAAYKAAQILGVSAQSVMSEAGKKSSQSHEEKINNSKRVVEKQNALLPELTLQCQRDHKLHCLSQKGLREAQVQVLGELLGDGAAAADDPPCPEILFTGSSDVVHVVSAMGVEGSVLLPQDQFDLQRGYPGQGLKVRLCPARLIQGERRPLSHQKKSIARYPDAACQDCREQDTDCLHHPSPIFVASVSAQAGRNPHLSATFCDRIFAAAVP